MPIFWFKVHELTVVFVVWRVEKVGFHSWGGLLDPAGSRFTASMVQNGEVIIHRMWSTIAHLIWRFYLMAVVRSVCGRLVFFASEILPRELLLSILTLLNTFLTITAISAIETLWEGFMPSLPMEPSFKMSRSSVRRIDWSDWAGSMHLPAGLWSALWSIKFTPYGPLEGCKSQVVLILTAFVVNAARLNPKYWSCRIFGCINKTNSWVSAILFLIVSRVWGLF